MPGSHPATWPTTCCATLRSAGGSTARRRAPLYDLHALGVLISLCGCRSISKGNTERSGWACPECVGSTGLQGDEEAMRTLLASSARVLAHVVDENRRR